MSELLIYETENFTLQQAHDCWIPGYLVLSSKHKVNSFSELPEPALVQFGGLVSLIYKNLEKIVKPDLIYFLRFGETISQLHFHIFPRTKIHLSEYIKYNADIYPVENLGVKLIDWVITKKFLFESESQAKFVAKNLKILFN